MTHQPATNRIQSRRLMDAGVDPNTADMRLAPYHPGENEEPSWSLSALLAMLPPYIEDYRTESWEDPVRCFLIVFPSENGEAWTVRYANGQNEDSEALIGRKGRTLVEAAVRMIETLVNKRIKLNNQ